MKTYQLSLNGYNNLLKKLDDLNKRADKLGASYVTTGNVRMYTDIKEDDKGNEHALEMVEFTLEGEKPMVNGYKMVAVLENVGGDNLIKFLIGEEDEMHNVYEYRRRVECDHCNHKRKRKHTFIVQNEDTGDYLQVGRTCLKDFLQGDISYMVKFSEINMEEIEKEASMGSGGERVPNFIGLDIFLALAIEYVNDEGYKRAGDYNSTANSVWNNLSNEYLKSRKYNLKETIDKNKEEAIGVINWAKEQTDAETTYLHNLSVIAKDGHVTYSRKGIASSMVIAYRRATHSVESNDKTKPRDNSEYVGEIGKKLRVNVEVMKVLTFSGQFGDADMLLLKDDNGNIMKWTTTTNHKLEEGESVCIEGKVKDHSKYRDVKQTTLTYVKKVN